MILSGVGVFEMIVLVTAVGGLISLLHTVVDRSSKRRDKSLELQREYLERMLAEVKEIKRRLEEVERRVG